MKTWKLYVQALSMSFIASSCCLLQLIVSLFGASCLGVVKTLQPFQAPLTAAVCVWWVHRARTCCSEERKLLLVPFFLSVGLLFSPLFIDLNVRARVSTDDLNTIHVSTQDVGCNACALAAKLSLEALEMIQHCDVNAATGVATCFLQNNNGMPHEEELRLAVEGVGHRFVGYSKDKKNHG